MVSLEGLIKFCELKGFLRQDFEDKDSDGNKTGDKSPRFFPDPNLENRLMLLQMDEHFTRSGIQKTRFFASWNDGSSLKCTFEHLRFTEKGLEYWLRVEDMPKNDSTILIVKR